MLFHSLRPQTLLGLLLALATIQTTAAPLVTWQTDSTAFALDASGAFTSITRRTDGHNYLATNQPAPLLSVEVDGAFHVPDRAAWDAPAKQLKLRYTKAGITASIKAEAKATHVTLELVGVEPEGRATLALWGPYPTTIRKTVGEVVGVVRDGEFALGLQALNPKTLGGFPENDEGSADRPYAARQTAWGSVLQSYSMDRSRPRPIAVWSKRAPNMPVPAIPGETVVGSRIALFGCPENLALETIGKIEVSKRRLKRRLGRLLPESSAES